MHTPVYIYSVPYTKCERKKLNRIINTLTFRKPRVKEEDHNQEAVYPGDVGHYEW